MNMRRALIVTAIVFALAALTGVVALLFPDASEAIKVFITSINFGGCAIGALAAAIVLERRRLRALMIIAIACAAGAFVGWSLLIWEVFSWPTADRIAKVCGTLTTLIIVLPLTGLLMLPRLTMPAARWTRVATIVAGVVAAVIINLGFWDLWPDNAEDLFARGAGIASVIAAAGLVCTPILYRLQATRPVEGDARKIPVHITCPRCDAKLVLPNGPSRCDDCGLRITITVEEPRCDCGYALYGLETDRCPECGRPISPDDRWPPSASKNAPTNSA